MSAPILMSVRPGTPKPRGDWPIEGRAISRTIDNIADPAASDRSRDIAIKAVSARIGSSAGHPWRVRKTFRDLMPATSFRRGGFARCRAACGKQPTVFGHVVQRQGRLLTISLAGHAAEQFANVRLQLCVLDVRSRRRHQRVGKLIRCALPDRVKFAGALPNLDVPSMRSSFLFPQPVGPLTDALLWLRRSQ